MDYAYYRIDKKICLNKKLLYIVKFDIITICLRKQCP